MGLNRNERIAELEKKKEQLANRIGRLRNMESAKQRKLDTRRKILAGAWILHRIDQDTDDRLRLMLMQGLDDFLEHPRDRELFDLPPKPPAHKGGFRMKTRSDRHPLIPVATTPEEFDACFASGEVFEASEELAAERGFPPTTEDVVSDEEFLSYPGTYPRGFPQDDPIAREM